LGIAALEQGLRWDATYRIVVSDERPIKNARVELVATIDNRLSDLKDTVLMLAIGMPNFPYRTQLASLIAPPGYEARFRLERGKDFPGCCRSDNHTDICNSTCSRDNSDLACRS